MITWEPQTSSEGRISLSNIARGGYDGYSLSGPSRGELGRADDDPLRPGDERRLVSVVAGVRQHRPRLRQSLAPHRPGLQARRREQRRWVWTPYVETDENIPFRRFYPGDRYVDWAGVDGYNWGGRFPWKSFRGLYARSYRDLLRLTDRPLMIGEVGCGEIGGSKSRWLRLMLRRDLPQMSHFRAVVWFDDIDVKGDLRIDTSYSALRSFRRWTSPPLYASSRGHLLRRPAPVARTVRTVGTRVDPALSRAGSPPPRTIGNLPAAPARCRPSRADLARRLRSRRIRAPGTCRRLRGAGRAPAGDGPFLQELERRTVLRTGTGTSLGRGAVPLVTWEPETADGEGIPLREIVEKRHDRYIRRSAEAAAAWGKPIMLRFAQEMNGDWYPWGHQVDGNTPRLYREAWHRVFWIFRNHGADNVKWVWSPNADAGGGHPLAVFYPGDEFVDWVGIDGFCWGGDIGWPSFTAIFGSTYDRIVKITSKPIMIAETAAGEDGGNKAEWISSALEREAPEFANVRALVWFNDEDPKADLRVDSSPAALAAFRKAIAAPGYGRDPQHPARNTGEPAAGVGGAGRAERRLRRPLVPRGTAAEAPRPLPGARDSDRGRAAGAGRGRGILPLASAVAKNARDASRQSRAMSSENSGGPGDRPVTEVLVLCYHAVSDTWPSPAALSRVGARGAAPVSAPTRLPPAHALGCARGGCAAQGDGRHLRRRLRLDPRGGPSGARAARSARHGLRPDGPGERRRPDGSGRSSHGGSGASTSRSCGA